MLQGCAGNVSKIYLLCIIITCSWLKMLGPHTCSYCVTSCCTSTVWMQGINSKKAGPSYLWTSGGTRNIENIWIEGWLAFRVHLWIEWNLSKVKRGTLTFCFLLVIVFVLYVSGLWYMSGCLWAVLGWRWGGMETEGCRSSGWKGGLTFHLISITIPKIIGFSIHTILRKVKSLSINYQLMFRALRRADTF